MADDYPRLVSDPEAEGLPGTADDDSTAYDDVDSPRWSDGPDPAALPGDEPVAVNRAPTVEQERRGTSIDQRLAEEEPDWQPEDPDARRTDGAPEEDEPVPGSADADLLDPPADYDTDYDPRSPVSLYDRPEFDAHRPVGRLVEPDEGGPFDTEAAAVAYDAGAAGGGATAEELAMHEVPPDREP